MRPVVTGVVLLEYSEIEFPQSAVSIGSPTCAESHGCPSSSVVCYGGLIKPWGSTVAYVRLRD